MMKIEKGIVAAAVLFALSPLAAQAEGMYAGVKVGSMQPSVSGFGDATNGGVVIGYALGDYANAFAIEGEVTASVSDGNIDVPGGKWDVTTYAVYGVYRFGSEFYGKVKLGALSEDVSASASGGSFSGTDSGVSVGIGGGYQLSPQSSVELEYTLIEQDVNFLSLGVNFAF